MDGGCWPFAGDTPNTTRISGQNQYEKSIAVSQTVWPNPSSPMMRPGVVILARGDDGHFQDALAGASLIHFPRNGPVLLTEPHRLLPIAAQEILRLDPTGKGSPAQVLLLGALSAAISRDVERLGYSTSRIVGGNPIETAVLISGLLESRQNVMIVSSEEFEEALPAGGWAAHMGEPILYSHRDRLPDATAQVLREEQPDVYLIGSTTALSPAVEIAVREMTRGFVGRISGSDPFELAVNFTRYRSPTDRFGWNVNERRGWSLRFARYDEWYDAVSGNPLSHLGKHSPLLLVASDAIPDSVAGLIASVNPRHAEPTPPFMHGFLVGRACDIDCPVQWGLDRLLETVEENVH